MEAAVGIASGPVEGSSPVAGADHRTTEVDDLVRARKADDGIEGLLAAGTEAGPEAGSPDEHLAGSTVEQT